MYGTLANQTAYSMQALKSSDGGNTWVWMSTVSYGAPSPCGNPSEHDCVYLRDGSIYCVWRSSGGPFALQAVAMMECHGHLPGPLTPLRANRLASSQRSSCWSPAASSSSPLVVQACTSGLLTASTRGGSASTLRKLTDDLYPDATLHYSGLPSPGQDETTSYTGIVSDGNARASS